MWSNSFSGFVCCSVAEAAQPVVGSRSQRSIMMAMDICIAKIDGVFETGKVSMLAAVSNQTPS